MVKVGVIGLGNMGQHHARVYRELGCLAAVVDSGTNRYHGGEYEEGTHQ